MLKERLVLHDDFPWKLGPRREIADSGGEELLQRVAGVDLSFDKENSNRACASLVVMHLDTMTVVYEKCHIVELTFPYVPGFLAFREVRKS